MTQQNIFEELQEKKQNLVKLATQAAEFGWIPKNKSNEGGKTNELISLEEIVEKLEKDTLTIGVIGQMKCGKSTFLNSFVFRDDILPAATTPMTAALSVITYGEKERLVAEFYTEDEWAEQQMQAARNMDEAADALDESKIKAAKELVEKSAKLGTSLNGYLGKTQEDSFDNLIEYVGADGKYVSITKSVTIYYPHEYLKGVEVVDTPGFNDPIVSREERTKEFLKKADVVIMMLYAGRPFDATDRDIIFKNVRQCGIGKVLVGINKYDIPYCSETNPEDENQIKEYVKSEIRKACRDCNDNTLIEILKEVEPIPLSAEMALLSELPMSKISSTESFNHAWNRHCNNFGISSQQEMYRYSHLDEFVAAVKNLVENEKNKILFAKPLNAIFAAGEKRMTEIGNEQTLVKSKIELLKMPDSDIEEKEDNLSKAHRRLSKKIDSLGDGIEEEIRNLIRKGNQELEDLVDATCKRMKDIVHNEWSSLKSFDSIRPKLNSELQTLTTRKLKRATQDLAEEGEKKIKRETETFFVDAEDLLMRYLPEFDSRDFIQSIKKKIKLEVEDSDLFQFAASEDATRGLGDYIASFLDGFLNGASFGLFGVISNVTTHGEEVVEVESFINSISNDFDPKPYLEQALNRKDMIIDSVKQNFISELIEPLQEQIREFRSQKADKVKELESAQSKLSELEIASKTIASQKEQISLMQATLA